MRAIVYKRPNTVSVENVPDPKLEAPTDVPIVVQHTRLDSRQSDEALLSTVAYSQ